MKLNFQSKLKCALPVKNHFLDKNFETNFLKFSIIVWKLAWRSSVNTSFTLTIGIGYKRFQFKPVEVTVMLVTSRWWWLKFCDNCKVDSQLLPTQFVSNIRHQHRCNNQLKQNQYYWFNTQVPYYWTSFELLLKWYLQR